MISNIDRKLCERKYIWSKMPNGNILLQKIQKATNMRWWLMSIGDENMKTIKSYKYEMMTDVNWRWKYENHKKLQIWDDDWCQSEMKIWKS